jgi:chitodextrinase
MSVDLKDVRTHALDDATAWWQNRPFPFTAEGSMYPCSVCGHPIMQREGTSLIGAQMRCPDCTAQYFAPPQPAYQPPPPAVGAPQPAYQPPPAAVVAPQPAYQPPPAAVGAPQPAYQPPPPAVIAPPAARVAHPKRRRNWLIAAAVTAAVAALVAGLLVWAPWKAAAPAAPNNVAVASSTATSATISWARPTSGASVDRFVIVRNGVQVASVTGERLSYTDKGLQPGVTYRYSVIAVSGSKRSTASAPAVTTTKTPSPVNVRTTAVGVTSVRLAWSPPPNAPQPTSYYVIADDTDMGTVPGSTTSYRVTDLAPGTHYRFQVAAAWAAARSFPTEAVAVRTHTPPLSAARLTGTLSLKIRITSTGGGNVGVGKHWTDSWTFNPACGSGPCAVSVDADFTPPAFETHWFRVTLRRHGAVYTGSTQAHITHCGVEPIVTDVNNTVSIRIAVKAGYVSGTEWLAKRFAGTLRIDAPYTQAGIYYCPAQTVTAALASTG